MASGNTPVTTGIINTSTLTFGEMKRIVASIVGAGSQPDNVEAGSAIHRALDWVQNHDWENLLAVGAIINVVAGTATYTLGSRFRKMKSMRVVSGNERKLMYIRKDALDRLVQYQSTSGLPTHYSTHRLSQDGRVTLWRTPDAAETINYDYYKDLAKPTNEGSVIALMPSEWEHMLITYAQYIVGLGRGLRSERLQMLKGEAEQAKQEALMRDSNEFDEDIGFQPDVGPAPMGAPFTGFDDASRWY